jgi:hypothetical protein
MIGRLSILLRSIISALNFGRKGIGFVCGCLVLTTPIAQVLRGASTGLFAYRHSDLVTSQFADIVNQHAAALSDRLSQHCRPLKGCF